MQALRPYLWMLLMATGLLIPAIFSASIGIRLIEASLILIIYVWASLRELKADGMLDKIMHALKAKISA